MWDRDAPVPPAPTPTDTVPTGLWSAPDEVTPDGSYLATQSDPRIGDGPVDTMGQGHDYLFPSETLTVTQPTHGA